MEVFPVILNAKGPLGIRFVEERRKLGVDSEDGDSLEVRIVVSEIKPNAKGLEKLRKGDVLFQVGYKSEYMKSWQWELVCGLPLEDAITSINEAKQGANRMGLRFIRMERKPEENWTSTFGQNLMMETSLSRERNLERKRQDLETSSVRVGSGYQCLDLPSVAMSTRPESGEKILFDPTRISLNELESYLARLFGENPNKSGGEQEFIALQCLHDCGYSIDQAIAFYSNNNKSSSSDLQQQQLWTDEAKRSAFMEALGIVKCRDFRAVRDEMKTRGFDVSVADLVVYFYTQFKTSPNYKIWRNSVKPDADIPSRTCVKCEFDDPYGDALVCCRCELRIKHLECFQPPLINIDASDIRWRRWMCDDCSKPADRMRKSIPGQPRALAALGGPVPDVTLSISTSARRSAQMASAIWAAMNETPTRSASRRPRSTEENGHFNGEGGEEDDDEEYRARKKGRSGHHDSQGRKIHFLKGVPIEIDGFLKCVEDKGGYDAVVNGKLWQVIRKELNLPHTTSSSTQLRDAYLDYVKQLSLS